jgi:hypothetical protein
MGQGREKAFLSFSLIAFSLKIILYKPLNDHQKFEEFRVALTQESAFIDELSIDEKLQNTGCNNGFSCDHK